MTLTDVDGHAVRKTGKTQTGTNIFGMEGPVNKDKYCSYPYIYPYILFIYFSFMIIFNCSFLSYLTFILLFSFVIVLLLKSSCRR